MKIYSIDNNINNRPALHFGDIKRCIHTGIFDRINGCIRPFGNGDYIIEAFKNNKVIQNYCKKNDVFVEMTSNQLPPNKNGNIVRYAAIHIKKIFPNNENGIFNKIVNFFVKKPKEEFYINAYSSQNYYAELKLVNTINAIKNENDLMKYLNRAVDKPMATK